MQGGRKRALFSMADTQRDEQRPSLSSSRRGSQPRPFLIIPRESCLEWKNRKSVTGSIVVAIVAIIATDCLETRLKTFVLSSNLRVSSLLIFQPLNSAPIDGKLE